MPDYKRKKIKKSFRHKKSHINTEKNINMTNKRQKNTGIVPEEKVKIVRGTKYKRKTQFKVLGIAICFICVVCIGLSALLPGGLYENIVNFSSVLGHGSYPTSVSGSTVLNTVSNRSYFYVLTDTNITAYSNSGKIVFDELHGFSNPIMSVSGTRALVYDQGGKSIYIYNLSGKIHSLQTKNDIITASISQNGGFAVSTHSDRYTSVATVYNKNFKEVFSWNSAKEIINNVLLNSAENKLAVSTLSVVSGQYNTKLLILGFDSAEPLHTLELGSSIPLSINNTGKGISIICGDKYKFLHWTKFNSNELEISGEISTFRTDKNGILLTVNRANDRSDNTIIIISKKGEKSSEFKINNSITDIQYNKGRVYLLCDTAIGIYDKNGTALRDGTCYYGALKFAVVGSNAVATVSDSEISKINIQEGRS